MAGRVLTAAAVRFQEKCKLVDSGCIEWQGGTTKPAPYGYGVFHVGPGKRMVTAHRWIYEQTYGSLTSDTDVCHHCDNRLCVNLAHLFAGTRKENMADAIAKSRTSRGRPRPSMQGSNHHKAVLVEDQIRAIRARHDAGEKKRALSDEFGVSFQSISRIVRRISWSHT